MSPNDFKDIRTKLGYTQQELADIIGYTRTQINNFEIGAHPIDKAIVLLVTLMTKVSSGKLRYYIRHV